VVASDEVLSGKIRKMGNTDNIYNARDGTIHADNSMLDARVGYSSVDKWFKGLQPSTVRVSGSIFKLFMKWLKAYGGAFKDFTPDQLIDYQDQAMGKKRYDILDTVEDFVQSQKNLTYEYKRKQLYTLRSFFLGNRSELPRDPKFNLKGDVPKVQGGLSPEEIRLVVLKANKMYRAIFLSMLGGAMGEEELVYWSNTGLPDLQKQLKENEDVIIIKQQGRKEKKNELPYFTLISGDALTAVKEYMAGRPQTNCKAIFVNQFGKPITKRAIYQAWTIYGKKIGLIKPSEQTLEAVAQGKKKRCSIRFGKNPHE
jgi:hypothetical protein